MLLVYIISLLSVIVPVSEVTVDNNRSFQNHANLNDHTQQTTETPGFKPFTVYIMLGKWTFGIIYTGKIGNKEEIIVRVQWF